MIDFLFGAGLLALVIRGWSRGLVRQLLDLGVLIIGIFLAFRLSTPAGGFVASLAGTSAEISRLIGGVAVFLAVSVGAAVAGHLLHRGVAALPGLSTVNRIGGAAVAGLWGLALTTLVVSLLAIVPTPVAVAESLEDSAVASALSDPEGVPQRAIGVVAGDRVMRTVLRLEELVGKPRIVDEGTEPVLLPPTESKELTGRGDLVERLLGSVNRARIEAGVDPLAWSEPLGRVAEQHAHDMYVTGRFGHVASAGDLGTRLAAASIPVVVAGENLVLGATLESIHAAVEDSPDQHAKLTDPRFRRIGIGIVEGPLGLMVVQVYTG